MNSNKKPPKKVTSPFSLHSQRNEYTIQEDINGENNITSEQEDMPLNRAMTQAKDMRVATDNPAGRMESLEELDFESAFNPYAHTNTNNAALSKKPTDMSGRYKKQTTTLIEMSQSEKAIISGFVHNIKDYY